MKHGKTAYRRPSNTPLIDSPTTPPPSSTSSTTTIQKVKCTKASESDLDFSDVEEEELTSITNVDDLIDDDDDDDMKQNRLDPDIRDLPATFTFPADLVTMKSTSRNQDLGICFGVSQIIGARSYQEDTFVCVSRLLEKSAAFFAVYDGHNGNRTSTMLRERLHVSLAKHFDESQVKTNSSPSSLSHHHLPVEQVLIKTFKDLDRSYIEEIRVLPKEDVSGSTACAVLLFKDMLYIANAGDSRCVLCTQNGKAKALSRDHKANDPIERKRIEDAGGKIRSGRVMGVLGVARSFGDIEFKSTTDTKKMFWEQQFKADLVSASPEIKKHKIDSKDEFLIIASDGVWDAMKSNTWATNFIRRQLSKCPDVDRAARKLVQFAERKRGKSCDNCTAIVIVLNQWGSSSSSSSGSRSTEKE